MALLRMKTWIDGHTGDVLSPPGHRPNEHAVPAASDVCAPGRLPGLDALPGGVTLMLETRVDLRPFRLDRGVRPHLAERRYAYTCQELQAAFAHPDVTRERIAEGTDPPERGRRLALYDALAGWIAHIEREWRDRAPAKPWSDRPTAVETLAYPPVATRPFATVAYDRGCPMSISLGGSG